MDNMKTLYNSNNSKKCKYSSKCNNSNNKCNNRNSKCSSKCNSKYKLFIKLYNRWTSIKRITLYIKNKF